MGHDAVGPATEVAFHSPDFGGLKRLVADPAWPAAPAGLLTVRSEQCSALIDRQISAAHRRVASYLRQYAPAHTARLDDEELLGEVERYESQAQRTYGVQMSIGSQC